MGFVVLGGGFFGEGGDEVLPGETFEGKAPCCYFCTHERPFSLWKQNDKIFYLCSPFYSKRTPMCHPCELGQGFAPFYKFPKQEN